MLEQTARIEPSVDKERVELERLQSLPRGASVVAAKGMIERVPVLLTVELGRTDISVKDLRQLRHGQVIVLDQLIGEPLGIFANGHRFAAGEVVAVGKDQYGIRVTALADEPERPSEAERAAAEPAAVSA